jgi:hypothetical protein
MKSLALSAIVTALSLAVSGCNDYETQKRLEKAAEDGAKLDAQLKEQKARLDALNSKGGTAPLVLKAEKQSREDTAKAELERLEAALYEWEYDTRIDQMTGTQTRLAHLRSPSQFEFAFPYGGGSHGSLMIRQRKKDGLSVLFSISKGQIVCPMSCTVRVRFDEKSPMTFTGTPPADHSSESLFLSPASKFVSELGKAKKTLVEVSYYQSGSRASEFKTEGFVWDVKAAR